MSDFLADHGVVVALICALAAVAYGLVTSRSLLALSPGNEVMRGLSAAIQEGASAYLRRQYTTIAIVGAVLLVVIGFALDWGTAIGFAIGAILSGLTGYIGMNISVRANVRTTEAARSGIAAELQVVLARSREEGFRHALTDHSTVLLGTRKHWWRTTEESLARALVRDGHRVALLHIA